MVTPESIEQNIQQGMAVTHLSVGGDGRHFEAVVVSAEMARRCAARHRSAVDRTSGGRRTAAAIPSFERSPLRGYAPLTPPSPCGHGVVAGVSLNCAPFAGKNRIQRHQRVYQTLGDRMREEIHALSVKTFTPQEWQEQQ